MKLLAVSVIVLLLKFTYGAPNSRIPKINKEDEFILDISAGKVPLTLTCHGDEPVSWFLPSNLPSDIYTITTNMDDSQDYKHSATLEIFEAFVEDTGMYECFYPSEPDHSDKFDSVYVYIDDGKADFVNPSNTIVANGKTSDEFIDLDCRVTRPDTIVKLFRGENEISGYVYYPQFGFRMTNITVSQAGSYTCKTDHNECHVIVKISIANIDELPEPEISRPKNVYFVVGHPFSLVCSVRTVMSVTFRWTDPHNDGPSPELMNKKIPMKFSTLVVDEAKASDTGNYSCMISREGVMSKFAYFYVTVLDSKEPFIKVESDAISQVSIMKDEKLEWKSYVLSFPDDITLVYRNPNGEKVMEDQRVSKEYKIPEGESWLRINEVQPLDFGNWTLEVKSSDGRIVDSVQLELIVRGAPEISVVPPRFTSPGSPVQVVCSGTAFPLPVVEWRIRYCSGGIQNCADGFTTIEPQEVNSSSVNRVNLEATFYLSEFSEILCEATNKFGRESNTSFLPVTDLGELFVVEHIGLKGSEVYFNQDTTVDVVVNDPFLFKCGITSSVYDSLDFMMPPDAEDIMDVRDVRSNYSQSKVTPDGITVTSQLSGSYFCSARNIQSQRIYSTTINIVVREEEPIMLQEGSIVGLEEVEISAKGGKPFSLVCDVTGAPEPSVYWIKDDMPVEFNDEVLSLEENRVLEIRYFRPEHAGTYVCVITQRDNVVRASAIVFLADPLSTRNKILFGVFGVVIIIVIVAGIYLILRLKKERAKSRKNKEARRFLFEKGKVDQLNSEFTAEEQAELLPYDKSFEIERSRIKIGRQLGSGAFGRVVKAEVDDLVPGEDKSPVAVKMCKSLEDPTQLRNLAIELKIMIHLGKHLNIVNLIGAYTNEIVKGELWILVEYCKYGDLLSFLQRYRRRFVDQIDPISDAINYKILTVVPRPGKGPLSPGGYNRVSDRAPTPSETDGYLVPSEIALYNPPKKSNSVTSAASESSSNPTFFAGNPGYGVLGATTQSSPDEVFTDNPLQFPLESAPLSPPVTMVSSSPPENMSPTSYHNYMNLQNDNPIINTQSPSLSPDNKSPPPNSRILNRVESTNGRRQSNKSGTGSDYFATRESMVSRDYYKKMNTDMTTLTSVSGSFRAKSPDVLYDSQGNPMNLDGTHIPGLTTPFTTTELVCWAWQVAQGMEYLTKRKILHGDLAARNLLLAEGNVVKISDFGLSRDMYKKDIYTKKGDDLLPIKWMSVEAIRDRMFSTESDIWAYGIVLWEMFSLGSSPYPGVGIDPSFLQNLEAGIRNKQPKYSNKDIYQLMLHCWEGEPEDRPQFDEIRTRLGDMLKEEMKENFDHMNEPYMKMNKDYFDKQTDYLSMFTAPDFNNIQKTADEDDPTYINVQNSLDEQTKLQNSEVNVNHCLTDAGYLSMRTLSAGHAEKQAEVDASIFSPNPVENETKFEFHTDNDLPLSTEDNHSRIPSKYEEESNSLLGSEEQSPTTPSSYSPHFNDQNYLNLKV